MKTIEINAFTFDELSDKAKANAIQWYKDNVVDNSETILFGFTEDCQTQASEAGFTDVKVGYSLSCSQGDGVSFRSGYIDREVMINGCFPDIKPSVKAVLMEHVCFHIGHDRRYAFASATDVEVELYHAVKRSSYPRVEEMIDKLQTYIREKYMALCSQFETTGYAWIENEYSDETIIDYFRNGQTEYLFTEIGSTTFALC